MQLGLLMEHSNQLKIYKITRVNRRSQVMKLGTAFLSLTPSIWPLRWTNSLIWTTWIGIFFGDSEGGEWLVQCTLSDFNSILTFPMYSIFHTVSFHFILECWLTNYFSQNKFIASPFSGWMESQESQIPDLDTRQRNTSDSIIFSSKVRFSHDLRLV